MIRSRGRSGAVVFRRRADLPGTGTHPPRRRHKDGALRRAAYKRHVPHVIETLLERRLVDMIALDVKTTWSATTTLLGVAAVDSVRASLAP